MGLQQVLRSLFGEGGVLTVPFAIGARVGWDGELGD